MARITEIYKEEALDRYATREYTNPDPKTSPVEGEFAVIAPLCTYK